MGLSGLSTSPSLSQSYLAPGSPSPIRPSQVSGFQNLCVSPPPLLSHFAPVSPELSTPAQTGSGPLGDPVAPFSGGGERGGEGPLTWPRPCRPPPHQPGFIKQTGPYIARPRGPGSRGRLIWRGGSARLLGRRWGEGGRRWDLSPARAPVPYPAPPPAPRIPPDPGSQSQLPISCLWNPGKSHPEPQCCPLSNGAGTPPWAVLKGLFQWVGDFKLAALEKLIPWGTRAASSGAQF